ncbi:MAG: hypothetical protein ABJF10_17750 [Chthoniobacter sp.]|uniref:hypothetical protein n=1 Tax=Chthoniobacter sp. TaxID=2510640 RepID=UPI0032ACC3AF
MTDNHDIPPVIRDLLVDAEKQLAVFANALGKPFDYSLDALGRLEHVLGEAWPKPPKNPEALDILVELFGAYFGESLRRIYGGRWVTGDGLPFLQGPHHPECKLFPFPAIYQKMAHQKTTESWVVAYCIASRPNWVPPPPEKKSFFGRLFRK